VTIHREPTISIVGFCTKSSTRPDGTPHILIRGVGQKNQNALDHLRDGIKRSRAAVTDFSTNLAILFSVLIWMPSK